ncbi:response regulator [Puia sp. P3]|uniref:response regulator n=1 Tax=Puia sp. P3 TaxID=3423952 RepID=UPI003D674246
MTDPTQTPTTNLTILLIDDEMEMFILLRSLLQDEGFQVDHAGSLSEARIRLQETRPALVLLDNRLPDGHGLDYIGVLRKLQPGIKVIVISGIDVAIRDYALESGADAFLRKPFTREYLIATCQIPDHPCTNN